MLRDASPRRISKTIDQPCFEKVGIRAIAGNSALKLSLFGVRQCLPMVIKYRTDKQRGVVSGSPETTPLCLAFRLRRRFRSLHDAEPPLRRPYLLRGRPRRPSPTEAGWSRRRCLQVACRPWWTDLQCLPLQQPRSLSQCGRTLHQRRSGRRSQQSSAER